MLVQTTINVTKVLWLLLQRYTTAKKLHRELLLWWLFQNPTWTIKLLSTFLAESINMTPAAVNSTRPSTNHNCNLGCCFRRPLMLRKFCGCSSKDKLDQNDFTGNACFGDFPNRNHKTFVTLVVVWSKQNRFQLHVGAWECTLRQNIEETIRTCLVEK